MIRDEQRLLIGLARATAAEAADLLGRHQGGVDWPLLLAAAEQQRVTALLNRSLQSLDSELAPGAALEQLKQRSKLIVGRNLVFTRELLRILELLAAEGIFAIPFKGPTLAVAAYGDPGLRQYSDIDLLVRNDDLKRARRLLTGEAYELLEDHGWQQHLFHPELKLGLDLHQQLLHHLVPLALDYRHLIDRTEGIDLLGQRVLVPSSEDLLLILCGQLVKELWEMHSRSTESVPLIKIVDVAELLERSELVWRSVLERARTHQARRLLLFGLELVDAFYPLSLPRQVRTAMRRNPLRQSFPDPYLRYVFVDQRKRFSNSDHIGFQIRVRDRLRQRLLLAFKPSGIDQEFLPLPKGLRFLHVFTRPLRLALQYGRDLIRKGSRSAPHR